MEKDDRKWEIVESEYLIRRPCPNRSRTRAVSPRSHGKRVCARPCTGQDTTARYCSF